jgi:hypothetical protein
MKTSVRPKPLDRLMLCSAGFGLALLAWPLLGVAQNQNQTTPPAAGQGAATVQRNANAAPDKDDVIRELIALTDAEQLEAIFSRQFIDRVANAVALVRPDLDPQTMRVIRQEATSVIRERIESGDALYSVLYPVYEKHFNIFELNQLVEFYQSPVGQKLVRVSPELLTESLALGREWGLSLVPEIMERVQSQLANQN